MLHRQLRRSERLRLGRRARFTNRPDGNVYVASHDTDVVKVFEGGTAGSSVTFDSGRRTRRAVGHGLWVDGRLYVGGRYSHNMYGLPSNEGRALVAPSTAARAQSVVHGHVKPYDVCEYRPRRIAARRTKDHAHGRRVRRPESKGHGGTAGTASKTFTTSVSWLATYTLPSGPICKTRAAAKP